MKQTKAELARLCGDVEKRWGETLRDERKSRRSESHQSGRLIHDAYILAVGAYLLEDDIPGFLEKVNLILQVVEKLHRRHAAGEDIFLVRDWPFHHEYFFYALCINDLPFAVELAGKCDPEKLPPLEDQHPFNVEFTSALRLIILGEGRQAADWIEKFEKRCRYKSNEMYAGYAAALRAIMERDSERLEGALRKIVEDYPRQSRSNEYFEAVAKALLCFYGIGLVHLARHHGLSVSFEHQLLPKTLCDLPPHAYSPPKEEGFWRSLFGRS